MISFKNWLFTNIIEEMAIQEMAWMRFGKKWDGYDVNKVPSGMWTWTLDKMKESPNWTPRIEDDNGQIMTKDQVVNLANIRAQGGYYQQGASPAPAASTPAATNTQAATTNGNTRNNNNGSWILAKAKVDEELPDHNNVPHKIRKGQYIALKDNGDGSWAYASLYNGKLQWHNAYVPQSELANRFERVQGENGIVRANKASDLAKMVYEKKDQKFDLTDEQKDISDTFKDIHSNKKDKNHMVINALAGTGKTTMLKHLAEKYGKRGQKWLYLVFGRKNREEASEEFPSFVDVYTTNSYAGQVLENNKIKPTERMAEYSKGTKVSEILDGPQYQQLAASLKIPHFDSPGGSKYIKGYMRNIWREFNREVEKLAGLAKAYNANPENSTEAISQIVGEHDINTELERTKERLQKDPNVDYFNSEISDFMGISDFLEKDFTNEMIQAASWVLEKSMPHGIDQKFTQTHERVGNSWKKLDKPVERNLRTLRDFDDDLWYAAQHADELDWSKPKKYDFVLVDEVQDFNKAQKVLLQKLVENGARVVAVGDVNQSMYRFRGADDNAFQDITNMLVGASKNPENTVKTLTKNFRSKPGIIDHSNKNTVVDNLRAGREYDPNDPAHISDKEVKYSDTISRLGEEYESLGELKKQTAFIARTNEPLAKAAMDLLKHKIPFVIYGKDIAGETIGLINRVLSWQKYKVVNDDSDLYSFIDELNDFVEDKKEKWSGSSRKAGQLKDLLEAQKALNAASQVAEDQLKNPTVDEFKQWLHQRLGGVPENMSKRQRSEHKKRLEEENPVILTTAHRSKGLEFDRVYELTPSMYPHPRTKLDADFAQEENSRYVASTRAKDEYHIVDDSEDE